MELALVIFNVGAGLGILAVGGAVAYLAWQATPLIRESRALTGDLRRLARTTERELRPLLDQAREVTDNVEVLSEDAAVKLERLGDLLQGVEQALATGTAGAASRRPAGWSVESGETREDGSDA